MLIDYVVIDRWGSDAVMGLFGEYHHAKRFADQFEGFEVKLPLPKKTHAARSSYDVEGNLLQPTPDTIPVPVGLTADVGARAARMLAEEAAQ